MKPAMKRDFSSVSQPSRLGVLPKGEELLWQGSPQALEIARRVLHITGVTAYFALLLGWRILTDVYEQKDTLTTLLNSIPVLLAGLTALGLLCLLAWLMARTTLYSITTHRLILQMGVALPLTVTIPLNKIQKADVLQGAQGSGDIVVRVEGLKRLGYVHFWPHVRPWSFREPQPSLRALANVQEVAHLFSKALHAAAGQPQRLFTQTKTVSSSEARGSRDPVLVTA